MHKTAKVATLSLLTAAFLSSVSYAADVYGKGSTKDAPASFEDAKVVNWSGFYIQGHGGFGNANHALTLQEYHPEFVPGEGEVPGSYTQETNSLGSLDGVNSSGFIGGGRLGYDYARGRLLFGVFADYNFTNMETELTIAGFDGDPDTRIGLEKDDEWSIGGRIGYIAAPRTLIYGIVAYTQTEYNIAGFDSVEVPEGAYLKKGATFDGLTVGGGIEFALAANVFFGVEYQHTFYGEETVFDAGYSIPEVGSQGVKIVDDLDEDKVMATLKIKLNSGVSGFLD